METTTYFHAIGHTNWQEFLGDLTQGPKPESFSPNEDQHDNGEACISNISPRERLKRLIGGVIPFVIALVILTWQISADVDRLWRLPLFFFFVSACFRYFLLARKTRVGVAFRGLRPLTGVKYKIEERTELCHVSRS